LQNNITSTLKQVFGFDTFLQGQEEVISRILAGHSTLAVFPTGQGKSLCYQLPALLLDNLTLVVSPLMALMKDQVDFLISKQIAAARLDSSLGAGELQEIYQQLRRRELKLLYVAPERFANERFLALITQLSISLLVIDEAHCISEWGHNFRPDYLKLAELPQSLHIPTILTLTATATPQVTEDIRNVFSIDAENYINTGFYRPNLTLRFSPGPDPGKTLLARLKKRPPGPSIVYVTLQATAEDVAKMLAKNGFEARAYHAGMKDEKRQQVQEWFMASDSAVVVATIAFGMGIDKNNIRYVYHYDLPKSLENYSQEIGRAGRDGKKSICELLGGSRDLITLENFVYGDTPEDSAIFKMIDRMLNKDDRFSLSVYEESFTSDMRPLVIKTLLTYLELEKVIASTGPFYSSCKFKPLKSSSEICSRFDAERAAFLKTIFTCAKKAQTWFTIDLDEAVSKTASNRQRIVTALNYLEEQGDLELKVSGIRLAYRLLKKLSASETKQLKEKFVSRFSKREQSDIKRLHQVVRLINHDGCKTRFLLNYFGEKSSDCGHCEYCLNGPAEHIKPVQAEFAKIEAELMAQTEKLQVEFSDNLSSPRQLARFFCGISSPRLTRAGLQRHPLFGGKRDFPFAGILACLKKQYVPITKNQDDQ